MSVVNVVVAGVTIIGGVSNQLPGLYQEHTNSMVNNEGKAFVCAPEDDDYQGDEH